MKSLWSNAEAANHVTDLARRVYTSQLLGRDASLVLHGGGNTSVKRRERNLVGEEEHLLYVKGSGWDLETIETAGFAPVRLEHLLNARQARGAVGPSDGERAGHQRDSSGSAGTLGGNDPARNPAA